MSFNTAGKAPGVYIQEIEMGAKPIAGVSTSIAGFVGVTEKGANASEVVFITSWKSFEDAFGGRTDTAPYMADAVFSFFSNGGSQCYIVSVTDTTPDAITPSDYTGEGESTSTDPADPVEPNSRKGLAALEAIDDISLILIPGVTDTTVQSAMIAHCEKMKYRFCILDAPKNATIKSVKEHKGHLTSEKGYGALYFPWITVLGRNTPPSGAIAGIYARSDNERGVHKAPANEVLRNVTKLELNLTDNDQGPLNKEGINCLRSFSGRGIRVWGARTLASDVTWQYINVRRLFIYLEKSIDEATQWVVFEPNNEQLWARVTQTISNFLTNVWRDGALMGTSPKEAFFVQCGRETMTQDDIDNGKLIVKIGVSPTKPAEFVIFEIAQWTGNTN